MTTLTVKIKNDEDWDLLKSILDRLEIEYDITKESDYDKDFVSKIKKGDLDILAGKTKKVNLDDIWK
ncbi:hypothetical protein M3O96_18820 [Aquiflexum sp. TKW24L]|uniref:DUF2683 family protein n=1 Tax=Aquiflexum sp. TKW24L TaxID=2942212 RepID=UPI0020BFB10F|nr:DUF2683 family protein [Aquiflexum sp. TKW24L]MCL6261163.1 hypothetical protein [Aquiflexum sp. TKW24L]